MKVNPDKCISCGMCIEECPIGAIDYDSGNGHKRAKIDGLICLDCGKCKEVCCNDAIEY